VAPCKKEFYRRQAKREVFKSDMQLIGIQRKTHKKEKGGLSSA
jgi:hypothetical protein